MSPEDERLRVVIVEAIHDEPPRVLEDRPLPVVVRGALAAVGLACSFAGFLRDLEADLRPRPEPIKMLTADMLPPRQSRKERRAAKAHKRRTDRRSKAR